MPVAVYILMAAWLAFAGWLDMDFEVCLGQIAGCLLGHDNVWRMLRGKLPPAQQKLQVRYLVLTFTSLAVLTILIILVMMWHTLRNE